MPADESVTLGDLKQAADVQEDHVPGQSKLLARLQALRYSGLLGREGDRAQVAMARRLLREGLAQCIHVPLEIALDPTNDPDTRLRAVAILAQHGLGTLTEKQGHLAFGGGEKGVALLPDFASIEQVAKAALEAKLAEELARGEHLADEHEIIVPQEGAA